MYRDIIESLVKWQENENRKILLLAGARGVGKTYTLRDFGEGCFSSFVLVDLKDHKFIKNIFQERSDRDKLINILEIAGGVSLTPGESLIVIENIDVVNDISSAMEFIQSNLSQFHVVLTTCGREDTMMSKIGGRWDIIEIITLFPLNFKEFLGILKRNDLCERIKNGGKEKIPSEEAEEIQEYVRKYLYIGGMPSVVQKYIDTQNLEQVEGEKQTILQQVENEINEIESTTLRGKVLQVWRSVPLQLNKENKKFQYGIVKLTARAREYEDAVQWLYENKYFDKILRVREPYEKLSNYRDEKSFEVFLIDMGLLSAMLELSYGDIMEEENLESLKEGAVLEQFIYNELLSNNNVGRLYYWISKATAKIEFIFEDSGQIIPIEINLKENTKAQSIKVYRSRYNPPMYISITENVVSMAGGVLKLPMYAIWNL